MMRAHPNPSARPRQWRAPSWRWVIPVVLGGHALVFWALADKSLTPKPLRFGPEKPSASPAPAPGFSAREEPVIDPETGLPATRREFTVPTRLVTPPPPARPVDGDG